MDRSRGCRASRRARRSRRWRRRRCRRSRAPRCWRPRPAPAPARPTPISCPPCCSTTRSSSRPAPSTCKTNYSTATCRSCARRSAYRPTWRCSRAARAISACTVWTSPHAMAVGRRAPWREAAAHDNVTAALKEAQASLDRLQDMLRAAAPRGVGLQQCWQRSMTLAERLADFIDTESDDQVQWFETYTRSFALHRTPFEIGESFQNHMTRLKAAWIFTSATLAVGDDFSHFCAHLGLLDRRTARWDSPFDYRRNALLYLPPRMPQPAAPEYTRAVIDVVLLVLRACGGRAFLLFTSHRALQEAAQLLKDQLPFPLLIQGTAPRRDLLHRFRTLGNAVLLGTSSFWEGVDVRGEALSVVIIDKLPFASPGDPVLQARRDALRNRGGEPFRDAQLPQAVITLKQGVGRLIRDVHDRGVLMLCDPRLLSKPYGKVFLNSLPEMTRSRAIGDVQRFFETETDTALQTESIIAERTI